MDIDEDEHDSIDDVSMNASDENELNDDADLDATEVDEGVDGDQEDQDDEDDADDDASRAQRSAASPSAAPHSPSDYKKRVAARLAALDISPSSRNASSYVIEPTAAAPHSAQIHAMSLSADGSTLLSGGSDGHVRRYDVYATMNGKSMLTQVLKHGFVEGVAKAGVLTSWWANEESKGVKAEEGRPTPRFVSPVHSLVCQQDALWGMSGSESGSINLFGIRHEPGRIRHVLRKHTSAVSAMTLASEETELISGGWDRDVHQWDLNTGQVVCTYPGHTGQVTSLSLQPQSGAGLRSPTYSPVRARTGSRADEFTPDSMLASGSGRMKDLKGRRRRSKSGSASSFKSRSKSPAGQAEEGNPSKNGTSADKAETPAAAPAAVEGTPANGIVSEERENEPLAVSNGNSELTAEEMALEAELNMSLGLALHDDTQMQPAEDPSEPTPPSTAVRLRRESGPGAALGAEDGDSDNDSLFGGSGDADADGEADSDAEGEPDEADAPPAGSLALPGGASANDAIPAAPVAPERKRRKLAAPAHVNSLPSSSFSTSISTFSSDVLLSTTLVGQVLLWDRRVRPALRSDGVAKGVRALALPPKTPPWCTAATWSADGSRIYVGRRNESVDEWDVRMLPDHDPSGTEGGASADPYPRFHRSLRCPLGSGPVTSLLAMPNSRHLIVGSFDNVRLWDTAPADKQRSVVPFRIIAGHHGASVSSMLLDPTSRILMTASGDRGWLQGSTEAILLYDVESVE